MISDRARLSAYEAALREVVRPGATVVDLGAGCGVLGLLACRMGAARVHAVEPTPIIEIARSAARANGYSDRFTFYEMQSNQVAIPARADVIVSDLRGALPVFGRHLEIIADARSRLLRSDGVLVPRRDVLYAAIVSIPAAQERLFSPWSDNGLDLDFSAARRYVEHTSIKVNAQPDQIVAPPVQWHVIDYSTVSSPHIQGVARFTVPDNTSCNGILVWFDSELSSRSAFSNSPAAPRMIYGQSLFPWPHAVDLTAGDRVTAALRADLVGDDYVWTWRTQIRTSQAGAQTVVFDQTTHKATVRSLRDLGLASANNIPVENGRLALVRTVLSMVDGHASYETIARHVVERHQGRYRDWRDALRDVIAITDELGGTSVDRTMLTED